MFLSAWVSWNAIFTSFGGCRGTLVLKSISNNGQTIKKNKYTNHIDRAADMPCDTCTALTTPANRLEWLCLTTAIPQTVFAIAAAKSNLKCRCEWQYARSRWNFQPRGQRAFRGNEYTLWWKSIENPALCISCTLHSHCFPNSACIEGFWGCYERMDMAPSQIHPWTRPLTFAAIYNTWWHLPSKTHRRIHMLKKRLHFIQAEGSVKFTCNVWGSSELLHSTQLRGVQLFLAQASQMPQPGGEGRQYPKTWGREVPPQMTKIKSNILVENISGGTPKRGRDVPLKV